MSKITILFIILFLILIINVRADKVDYRVEEELEDKEEVSVVVILKEDKVSEDFSILSDESKNSLLEKGLEHRRLMVGRQQAKVLAELRLKKAERGLLSKSNNHDFELKHSYSIINGFSGKVTKEGLKKLKNNENVAKIYYDGIKYLTLSSSIPQINANDVWALRPNGLNLTGQNQTVCVVDSGVDYTHPNLGNCNTANFTNGTCSRVIFGWDYHNSDNDPIDDHGHGTHVAGIIISNHSTNKGVAPDAKIVALKVCDNDGTCLDTNVVKGIDWCIANRTLFNISIITLSLGSLRCYTSTCDVQDSVVNAANDATSFGIFVDVATGNDNATNNCVTSPACGSNVTAVGGVQDDDATIQYNRATFMHILAPSQTIRSTILRSGGVYSDPSGFLSLSGTSMSAPHVAGVAALMLQFNSSLSPLDIRRIMNNTGKSIDDSGTTYKRVDALAAIQSMDKIAPLWSNNATNNTSPKNNEAIQFNITFNDTIGLSFYIFSWNDTGSWVNITNGTLSGTLQSISANQIVTATRGKNVYWKFYCNDTNNNWNMTDQWNFSVQNTIPTVQNLTLNSTDRFNRTNGSLVVYFDYYDVDNDANALNETRWYNGSKYISALDNLTSISSGNLTNGDVWLFSIRVYDDYNWGVWYNSSNITVSYVNPYMPTLNGTLNNSVLSVNYTMLNWSATNYYGASMTCYVYGDNTTTTISLINITRGIANGTASTFNWTNLNETTYYWKVQCDDGISNSSNSSIYQFTIAIPPTTKPSITSVIDYDSDGNIEINWSDDGNESSESYRIYRFTNNITSINSSVTNLTYGIFEGTQFFEDNSTNNGTTYWYVLVTVDSKGNYNDSVFSNSLNGTANDTIKPRIPQVINVTSSSGTTTINWSTVRQDINGNSDNFSLNYKIWYKLASSANLSKALVNETADYITTVSGASVCSGDYCKTTHSLSSTSLHYYFVTTLDDGNNENLTLDNSSTGNYGNVTATSAPSIRSDGNGGGSGGGVGGGGGGGTPKVTNLDLKTEFISGLGYTVKQTQGDESTFTLNDKEYTISITQLKSDSVTINIAGASSVFKEGDVKEFDVDNDGHNDLSITLSKIIGGRAEIIYKWIVKPKEEEKVEEKQEEPKKTERIEEKREEIEEIKEEKLLWVKWFFVVAISVLALLIITYVVVHKYLKSSK